MDEPKKTRKSPELLKEDAIRIRVTKDQKRVLAEAAQKAGLGLSSWLLSLGLREAQKSEKT